jgi:creatinine amidohydrolase
MAKRTFLHIPLTNWGEVSKDTGVGNPKKSTATKGKLFAEAVVAKISKLLVDLDYA